MSQSQLFLELGGDFVLTSNGSLAMASGWDAIRQNFERFVFTNPAIRTSTGQTIPADWVFHPTYGLGARAMIGMAFGHQFMDQLKQKVYQGALAAQSGNSSVPPQVTVTQGPQPNQVQVTTIVTPEGGNQQTLLTTLP